MYGDQGIFANAGIPYSRWASMKRQVVLQMGLCHLREALKMKNDVDEVTIPKKFSYEAYSKTIEELYASQAEHFLIDRASDELHTSYYTSIEELTIKVFVNLSVNKATKGKNGRKAVVELAVDSDQLPGLVQQNSMKDAAMSLIRFFQRIEEEVLLYVLVILMYLHFGDVFSLVAT